VRGGPPGWLEIVRGGCGPPAEGATIGGGGSGWGVILTGAPARDACMAPAGPPGSSTIF
jgi:hypothetical protein